jgi:hypothetical protein
MPNIVTTAHLEFEHNQITIKIDLEDVLRTRDEFLQNMQEPQSIIINIEPTKIRLFNLPLYIVSNQHLVY